MPGTWIRIGSKRSVSCVKKTIENSLKINGRYLNVLIIFLTVLSIRRVISTSREPYVLTKIIAHQKHISINLVKEINKMTFTESFLLMQKLEIKNRIE